MINLSSRFGVKLKLLLVCYMFHRIGQFIHGNDRSSFKSVLVVDLEGDEEERFDRNAAVNLVEFWDADGFSYKRKLLSEATLRHLSSARCPGKANKDKKWCLNERGHVQHRIYPEKSRRAPLPPEPPAEGPAAAAAITPPPVATPAKEASATPFAGDPPPAVDVVEKGKAEEGVKAPKKKCRRRRKSKTMKFVIRKLKADGISPSEATEAMVSELKRERLLRKEMIREKKKIGKRLKKMRKIMEAEKEEEHEPRIEDAVTLDISIPEEGFPSSSKHGRSDKESQFGEISFSEDEGYTMESTSSPTRSTNSGWRRRVEKGRGGKSAIGTVGRVTSFTEGWFHAVDDIGLRFREEKLRTFQRGGEFGNLQLT